MTLTILFQVLLTLVLEEYESKFAHCF